MPLQCLVSLLQNRRSTSIFVILLLSTLPQYLYTAIFPRKRSIIHVLVSFKGFSQTTKPHILCSHLKDHVAMDVQTQSVAKF